MPAQIYIRPSERDHPKLGTRSEHGTLVGMSSKGNGFIFYVPRNNSLKEVDSKDVLFNETFHDVRNPKGKIVENGTSLPPDLGESHDDKYVHIDGRIEIPHKLPPLTISNRFDALTETDPPVPIETQDESPSEAISSLP
jgi:hypothetical protein